MLYLIRVCIILLVISSSYETSVNNKIEIKLIKKYVQQQIAPPQVIVYICWSRRATLALIEELESKTRLLVMRNFTKVFHSKNELLIVSDSRCEDFSTLLQKAEKLKLLQPPYKWLVLGDNQKGFIPPTTKLLLDSNFAFVRKISKNHFQLNLLYKITPNNESFLENDLAGFADEDFLYFNDFSYFKNRSNLMRSNLTVSYVMTNPAYPLDVTHYRHRHIDAPSKISYSLVLHVLEMLNSTGIFMKRRSWGYKAENATYYDGGMFGDLQNGTAEIAGTVALYTLARMDIVEYIGVTTPSRFKFFLKAPPLSYVYNIFALPFEVNVWYYLYAMSVVTLLILYLTIICENRTRFKKENNKPRFLDVVWMHLGAMTQQASETEAESISGRIAMFIVFLMFMFLYTAYSASIVVLLQSSSDSLRNVEDLLNSKISLGIEDIVYNKFLFATQTEPIRKAIYEKKIVPKDEKPHFMSVERGIAKVRNEFFAFHVEANSGYKAIMDTFQEHEVCGLIEIDYLNALFPSFSLRKNSSYKEIVKVGFKKVHESGLRDRQVSRIYFGKPRCGSKESSFTSVGLIDVYFLIEIFCTGILLAVCLLFLEILFKKYQTKFSKQYNFLWRLITFFHRKRSKI